MGFYSYAKSAIKSLAPSKPSSSNAQAAASLGAKATSAPSVSSTTSSAVKSVSPTTSTNRTTSGGSRGGGGGGGGGGSSRSSGGGSTPIVSTSGAVTGTDTGSQSVVSTTSSQKATNILTAGLNKTTPTAGEILTRGLTSGSSTSTSTTAEASIKSQLLKDYPTLERTRDVNKIAGWLASGKMKQFGGKEYKANTSTDGGTSGSLTSTSSNGFADMGSTYTTKADKVQQIGLLTLTEIEAQIGGITKPALVVSGKIGTSKELLDTTNMAVFVSSNYKPTGFATGISSILPTPYGTLKENQQQIDVLKNVYSFQSNPQEYAIKFPSNVEVTSSTLNDGSVSTSYKLLDFKGGAFTDTSKYMLNAPVEQQISSRMQDVFLIGPGKIISNTPGFLYDIVPKQRTYNPENLKEDPSFKDILFGNIEKTPTDNVNEKIYSNLGKFGEINLRTLESGESFGTFTGKALVIAPTIGAGVTSGYQRYSELKGTFGLTTKEALGGVTQETIRTINPISFKTTGVFNLQTGQAVTRQVGSSDIVNLNLGGGKSTIGGSKTTVTITPATYDTIIPTGVFSTRTITTTEFLPSISRVNLNIGENLFTTNKGITTGAGTREVVTVGYEYAPKGFYGLTKNVKTTLNIQGFTTSGIGIQTNWAKISVPSKGGEISTYGGTIGDASVIGRKFYGGGEERLYLQKEGQFGFGKGDAQFTNLLRVERINGNLKILSNVGRMSKASSVANSVKIGEVETPFGKANVYQSGAAEFAKSGKYRTFGDFNIYDITKNGGIGTGGEGYSFKVSKFGGGTTQTQISKIEFAPSKTSAVSSSLTNVQQPVTLPKVDIITKSFTGSAGLGLQTRQTGASVIVQTQTRTTQTPLVNTQTLTNPNTQTLVKTVTKVGTKINTRQFIGQTPALQSPLIETPLIQTPFIPPGKGFREERLPQIDYPSFIPPIGIPSFPSIGINSMIGKAYKGKLRREYTPSIGAILKGVKAPKISTSVKFAEMTGFQARPMITRASKRKKKR